MKRIYKILIGGAVACITGSICYEFGLHYLGGTLGSLGIVAIVFGPMIDGFGDL